MDLRTDYPRRIRVKGGTVIHALKGEHSQVPTMAATACQRIVDLDETVAQLNKAAPVSCKACNRALGGES